jgi:hypothetical protein
MARGSSTILAAMRTMARLAIIGASLGLLGCGASTEGPAALPSATPAASPSSPTVSQPTPATGATPTPTPATVTTSATGGFGDTSNNPDSQYICAAKATEQNEVIAYTTVAGPDATDGEGVCTSMEQGSKGAWTDIAQIASGSFETAPICWITAGNGAVTQRIYTAIPNGDDNATAVLCDDLFTGAGVKPQ